MALRINASIVALVAVAGFSTTVSEAHDLRGLVAEEHAAPAVSACGQPLPVPRALPPAASGPVVYLIAPCFGGQGRPSHVSAMAYVRDIRLRVSKPRENLWVPYDAQAERVIFEDFQRLWKNHQLADLSIEVRDYPFPNGVVGKLVTYNITERN